MSLVWYTSLFLNWFDFFEEYSAESSSSCNHHMIIFLDDFRLLSHFHPEPIFSCLLKSQFSLLCDGKEFLRLELEMVLLDLLHLMDEHRGLGDEVGIDGLLPVRLFDLLGRCLELNYRLWSNLFNFLIWYLLRHFNDLIIVLFFN